MSIKRRLFDYAKLIADVQKKSGKTQEELSESLNCTPEHISKVKRNKSTFSVDKILQLVNEYNCCIDDYIDNGTNHKRSEYEEKEGLVEMDSELYLPLLKLANKVVSFDYKDSPEDYLTSDSKERIQKIAKCISKRRMEVGIPVKTMAEKVGVKETTFQNIENGCNGTTIEKYIQISTTLDVALSYLMRDVIKNKDVLIDYELEQIFSQVNFIEKKAVIEMINGMVAVVQQYMNR